MTDLIQNTITRSTTYEEYIDLTRDLFEQGLHTGKKADEDLLFYTKLNLHRIKRIEKKVQIPHEIQHFIQSISSKQHWVVISEGWCGDAAQSLPIFSRLAQLNELIELQIVLRDENEEFMNQHLTNGGKAIPKLIVHNETWEELFEWGPRPAPLQKIVEAYKANPDRPPYKEFSETIQRWYIKDKGVTILQEILALLKIHTLYV